MREYGKGTRDPSSHRTPEQIHDLDSGYNHTPLQIKRRSERNHARREVTKRVGAAALKGKDIDHRDMLKNGGSNAPSNWRIRTEHQNRGWRRDQ